MGKAWDAFCLGRREARSNLGIFESVKELDAAEERGEITAAQSASLEKGVFVKTLDTLRVDSVGANGSGAENRALNLGFYSRPFSLAVSAYYSYRMGCLEL